MQVCEIGLIIVAGDQVDAANGRLLDEGFTESDKVAYLVRRPDVGVLDGDELSLIEIRSNNGVVGVPSVAIKKGEVFFLQLLWGGFLYRNRIACGRL